MQTAFNAGAKVQKKPFSSKTGISLLLKRSNERLGLIGDGIFCFRQGAERREEKVFFVLSTEQTEGGEFSI